MKIQGYFYKPQSTAVLRTYVFNTTGLVLADYNYFSQVPIKQRIPLVDLI